PRRKSESSSRRRGHGGCTLFRSGADAACTERPREVQAAMIDPNDEPETEMSGDEAASAAGQTGARLSEQSKKVLKDVRELGGIAAEGGGEVASRLRSQGGELLEEGKDKLASARSGLEGYITANPLKSVLVALGAGALLGLLIFRRPSA